MPMLIFFCQGSAAASVLDSFCRIRARELCAQPLVHSLRRKKRHKKDASLAYIISTYGMYLYLVYTDLMRSMNPNIQNKPQN